MEEEAKAKKTVWLRICWACCTTAGGGAGVWKGLKVPKSSVVSLLKDCLLANRMKEHSASNIGTVKC